MGSTGSRSGVARLAVALLAATQLTQLGSATQRADIVLDVDLEHFELRVIDAGVPGPRFRVSTGTPHTPTPRGRYELNRLVANPSYTPGPDARRRGATARGPSSNGPLGVAKIPFRGAYQLHGGGHRFGEGMPVTLGCIQLTDPEMQRLADWFDERGALGAARSSGGERVRPFVRTAQIHIY